MNKEEIYMEYKPSADDFVLHCLSIFHPQPPDSAKLGFNNYENEENLPSRLIYVPSVC